MENLVPVFKFIVKTQNSVKCTWPYSIKNTEKLNDDPIEVEDKTGKSGNIIVLKNINKYIFYAKICSCNINANALFKKNDVGKVVFTNTKIPIFYLSILYEHKQFVGELLTHYVYFNLDEKSKLRASNPKKLENQFFTGNFSSEVAVDDGFLSKLIETMTPKIENKLYTKYSEEYDATENKIDVINKIDNELNNILDEYRNLFEEHPINTIPSLKFIKKLFKQIPESTHINDILECAIEFRENIRRKDMDIDTEMMMEEQVKKTINLKEFKEHPEKLTEYLNEYFESSDNSDSHSDSDSD
jgi:hypothetical protein